MYNIIVPNPNSDTPVLQMGAEKKQNMKTILSNQVMCKQTFAADYAITVVFKLNKTLNHWYHSQWYHSCNRWNSFLSEDTEIVWIVWMSLIIIPKSQVKSKVPFPGLATSLSETSKGQHKGFVRDWTTGHQWLDVAFHNPQPFHLEPPDLHRLKDTTTEIISTQWSNHNNGWLTD